MNNYPLVSVCVVTYNSSAYVLEALESVKEQTYKNIELVVSDDASTDDTVELCRKWLAQHQDRFNRTKLLTVEHNTGVAANCNRSRRNSTGVYVKGLAGDDKLLPNCIEDNVEYMNAHAGTDIVFSDEIIFGDGITGEVIESYSVLFDHLSEKQFKLYQLVFGLLPAQPAFMSRNTYDSLGGYDETIPMMEDKPFWVKAVFSGKRIGYFKKPTVGYRVNPKALSQSKKNPSYSKLTESRKVASKIFLEKMREISVLLWFYGRNNYNYQFSPSIKTFFLHSLRFFNPYFYHLTYLTNKIRFYKHLEK